LVIGIVEALQNLTELHCTNLQKTDNH